MYKSVWKCRLCGERFLGDMNFTEEEVVDIADSLEKNITIKRTVLHECFGGDYGVADLQGWHRYV